jgi:Spy/CpxP family protein refolding chaperone
MKISKIQIGLFQILEILLLITFCGVISSAAAQQMGGAPPYPCAPPFRGMGIPPPLQWNRPPMEQALHVGPPGRWWDNPEFSKKLSLTSSQQKTMDEIFQKSRLKLIDLMAAVQKEEAIMEPLIDADQPDESKVVAQIDKVAQARANLEKANARMLLGIRRVLTPDQWKKLQAEAPPMPFAGDGGRGWPPPPIGAY